MYACTYVCVHESMCMLACIHKNCVYVYNVRSDVRSRDEVCISLFDECAECDVIVFLMKHELASGAYTNLRDSMT